MSWVLALPLIIPFATAIAAFLARRSRVGAWISVGGSVAHLLAAIALLRAVLENGVVAGQMGGWPAPFGITLVADHLSAAMVLITGVVAVAVSVYALADL
ncbi:MAG: hypothetical protein AAFW46_16395 [Pseudomonadota bacterium]